MSNRRLEAVSFPEEVTGKDIWIMEKTIKAEKIEPLQGNTCIISSQMPSPFEWGKAWQRTE
jgi:hypothetical protein